MNKLLFILIFLLPTAIGLFAQKDSIVFKNGENIVGEIKDLDKNVLKMETTFSDDDFTIDWGNIREIHSERVFLIRLSGGTRYEGKFKPAPNDSIVIVSQKEKEYTVLLKDIVFLKDINDGFWSKVYASIDFGFNLTRSNNFKQLSMRSNFGFKDAKWQLDINYNTLNSKQDNSDQIERTDGGATFKLFLPNEWYPLASIDFVTNNEQQIKLRSTAKLGIGNYIINNNKVYWGFSAGANFNKEDYSNTENDDRQTWEGFGGTELNFFNAGDLSLLTRLVVYPGFTEKGRLRADFKTDLKYDLPLDFYIKIGFTLNFDNQPASGSSDYDYVMQTGIGWSL
jgi:hypothetical protein